MRIFVLALLAGLCWRCTFAQEWTRFRGADGAGIAPGSGYPDEFKRDRNAVWRTPVRPGKSSPILTKDHVFLTGYDGGKLYTQCFDRNSGKLLWERSVDRRSTILANRLNHPAAITPVTDGESVYSFFKDFGFVSYDRNGKLRWQVPMGPFDTTMGLGASPVIAGGNLVLLADQVQGSFIAAVDRANGELRWKTEREEGESWGTPVVHASGGEAQFVISISRGQLGAYTPDRGKRVYTLRGSPTTIVGSPLIHDGVLYVQGYGSEAPAPFSQRLEKLDANRDGQLSADEYGDDPFLHGIAKYVGNRDGIISEAEWNVKQREVMGPNCLVAYRIGYDSRGVVTAQELWRYEKSFTGVIPSPLVYQGVVYFVKNGGILTALDAKTGALLKTGRITGALGGYSTSPVAADGKIYLASEEGSVAVIRAGADWEVLSVSPLGESCYATPALSAGEVYLRTDEALYRFRGSVAASPK